MPTHASAAPAADQSADAAAGTVPTRRSLPPASQPILAARLIALFAAGWLGFNFPLLGLWDRHALCFGIPVLPLGLFALWLALIVALAWTIDRVRDDGS